MKLESLLRQEISGGVVVVAAVMICFSMGACKKNSPVTSSYQQTTLVGDSTGFNAVRVDTDLDNAWGIAIGPTGIFWIADNHSGKTSVYDGNGAQVLASVGIPLNGEANGASPTGVVYNGTTDFVIPSNGQPSKFIYVTEDGIITGWNTGDTTITVTDRTASNAVYKGVTIANDGSANFLYATDFHNAKVDVFDRSFNYVTNKSFSDPGMPGGFAPFNIQNINGQLYVTYAQQKGPDNEDDESGVTNGYVDIYKPDGTFVKRFASKGPLNSPWGITQAPSGFGQGSNSILVGNFGDGFINIYDADGNFQGQLTDGSAPISINGLWAISFPQSSAGSLDVNTLYFTAGPQSETYGVFGYLKKR